MAVREELRRSLGSNNPDIPHPASVTRPMVSEEWDYVSPSGYRVSEHMINEPRPGKESFKIIMAGCGPAGIDFLHHAMKEFGSGSDPGVEFVCFEKNHDVGGTWLENRYPGCACDVPSASYQFPWRPNPDWTKYYSPSKEIWEYFKKIVDEEGMMKYIRLQTAVTRAEWDEDRSKWLITLQEHDMADKIVKTWAEECDLFLTGTGILNAWKWPEIPGLMSFKGKLFHTARYDENYDIRGKRVAVIGSGSSGVQTVASVYNDAAKVYTWVRTPTWITAGFGPKFAGQGGSNFSYDEAQKKIWRSDPEKYRIYRKMVEDELNSRFRFILRNSKESDDANEFSYNEMTSKLGDNKHLKDTIIPTNFNVGCRRATPGNGYLEALVGEKTTCYTEAIQHITENGFLDPDGAEVEVDVIICATGFDTTFRPRFPIIGLDKQDLAARWAEELDAYVAVSVPHVPNYFTYTGPYGPLAQGSVLPLLTLYSNYFITVIKKMRKEHIRRLSPKESAAAAFREHAKVYVQRTAWADPCSSWFKQGRKDGNIVMWPGSRLAFFDVMREPKFEDYEIEYWGGNRWGYLGSGFTTEEYDGASDISYYLNCRLYPEIDEKKEGLEGVNLSEQMDVNGLLPCTPGHIGVADP